jgi:hypothetical protein
VGWVFDFLKTHHLWIFLKLESNTCQLWVFEKIGIKKPPTLGISKPSKNWWAH